MKRLILLFVLAVVSSNLIGQKLIDNLLVKHAAAYNRAAVIYNNEVNSAAADKKIVLLEEAHDSIDQSDAYLNQIHVISSDYDWDLNVKRLQNFSLYYFYTSLYNAPAKPVFSTTKLLKRIEKLEEFMPKMKHIVMTDLKLKYTSMDQAKVDEMQYGAYWNMYKAYKLAKDTAGIKKSMHRYIKLLREKYVNSPNFCEAICSDTSMIKQVDNLENLLSETNQKIWDEHELDYGILEIELKAEERKTKQASTKNDIISTMEKTLLLQNLLLIDLTMDLDKPDFVSVHRDELMRLKQATRILELNDMYQQVYTALVKSSGSTDEERWEYLEEMKRLVLSTSSNLDLMDRIDRDMLEIGNRLADSFHVEDSFEEPYKRLMAYYELAEDKAGVKKCQDALATIETNRIKREKREAFQRSWGLSVGFAPIKTLFYGGKQASYFVDIKTFGLSHGARYCRFDGFTDNYRFYSWVVSKDKPGGSYTYSGYEASYWLGLFSMRNDFVFQRLCLEYRFGNYEFEPLTNATLLNRSTGEVALTGVTLNPVGNNHDVSLVYRLQLYAGSRFFVEANVGLGLGYRTIKADQDLKTYEINDDAYNDKRWNRVTLPGRLGLRCGIKLF